VTDDDLCRMSNLPPDQCALPCHRNESLPAGFDPEVRRGVEPSGTRHSLTVPAAEQHEPLDTRSRPVKPKRPKTACRYVGDDWVTREHLRDCDDSGCEGCKPCGEDHCALHGRCPNHVNVNAGVITCPSCIADFRANVAEVETLTALVHAELEHAPIEDGGPFPDPSEVVVLSGPFADPDQIDARRAFVHRQYEARGWCDYPKLALLDFEDNHPTEVLARMERDLRHEYGQPEADELPAQWPLPHTVQADVLSRSCAYLTRMLDGRFPHDERFEQCDTTIHDLRTHLEAVLSDSRAPETGAPCPTCVTDPLVKPKPLVLRRGHWCEDPECTREHDKTGAHDRWVCPLNSRHEFTVAEYRLRIGNEYLARAERLKASDIKQQYGISRFTISTWCRRQKLHPVGKDRSGHLLYRVADLLALRDATPSESPRGEKEPSNG
jgi:hypothetical protein